MKQVSIVILAAIVHMSAQAGPRFLNSNIESKILGSYKVSMKVSELPLSIAAVPETIASIDRDNGQIESMNCVTSALFKDVATFSVTVYSPSQIVSQKSGLVDVILSNSYSMQEPDESCNASPLHEITTASVASRFMYTEIPVQKNGETLVLSISTMAFLPLVDVTVSGDENRMSLDWVDLFTPNQFSKPTVNFSVSKRSAGSVSFLEHGTAEMVLQ